MPVRLGGATSGYTELTASAAAGNNTITVPAGNGAAYQVLRNGANAGTLEFSDNIVSGTAVSSTSGTVIDFTGIPSWVKRVTVMFNGVSTSGTSNFLLQLGTASGNENTGYVSTAYAQTNVLITSTSGFALNASAVVATDNRSGTLTLNLLSGNTWMLSGIVSTGAGQVSVCSGSKSTASTLDRIRVTTVNGTDTFDAGSINILYE